MLGKSDYLIIPISMTNSPMPNKGGRAMTRETPQINCKFREVKKLLEVTAYHEPSFLTTDLHLKAANAVIV